MHAISKISEEGIHLTWPPTSGKNEVQMLTFPLHFTRRKSEEQGSTETREEERIK